MSMAAVRPRVFISSTIYDFKDLRSAIKFWLEELGYEVYASEFNDFKKDLDKNSYEACLATIDESGYFILLIGARAGGWYDRPKKTTITMKEYRHAYERAKVGKLKIFTFVRKSVWDVREDRNALIETLNEEYASEHGLSCDDIEKIGQHRSRVVIDSEVIFSFLDEVARNTEMKAAATGASPLPVANWIHRFETFRDVIDALRVDFAYSGGLRKFALIANLRTELINNLIRLFQRSKDGTVSPLYEWASWARSQYVGGMNDESRIKGKYLTWVAIFSLLTYVGSWLNTRALDEAIVSGEFLDYDNDNNRYISGPIQSALILLRENIDKIRVGERDFTVEEKAWLAENYPSSIDGDTTYEVDNSRLIKCMAIHDRYYNAVALSTALVKAFGGKEFVMPSLCPSSPLEKEVPKITEETPSVQDIEAWIKNVS